MAGLAAYRTRIRASKAKLDNDMRSYAESLLLTATPLAVASALVQRFPAIDHGYAAELAGVVDRLAWTPATAPSGRRMYEARDSRFNRPAQCMRIGDHWEAFGSVNATCPDGEPGVVLMREAGATAKLAQAAFADRLARVVAQHGLGAE